MRAALLAITLALLAPAAADARVPMPRGVTVSVGECPGYPEALGCLDQGRVWLARASDKVTRYHELGHAWDEQTLTDVDRQWFARKLGRPAGEWIVGPHQVSAGELFADAYSRCALPLRHLEGSETMYGYQLRGKRHQEICNAIHLLGLLRG